MSKAKIAITQAITITAAGLGAEMSEQRLEIYVEALADISLDNLLPALRAIVETREYPTMPTVGAIRAMCADLEMTRQGIPSAMEAWSQVSRRPNAEAHPIAKEAFLQIGGWHAFGRSDVSAEVSWRARFDQAYSTLIDRYRRNELMLSENTRQAAGLLPVANSKQKVDTAVKELFSGMRQ